METSSMGQLTLSEHTDAEMAFPWNWSAMKYDHAPFLEVSRSRNVSFFATADSA
jgi:hypothetical protein